MFRSEHAPRRFCRILTHIVTGTMLCAAASNVSHAASTTNHVVAHSPTYVRRNQEFIIRDAFKQSADDCLEFLRSARQKQGEHADE